MSAEGITPGAGCACPEGRCLAFEQDGIERPQSECVMYLSRTHEMVTKPCEACGKGGSTWHMDGQCCRCLSTHPEKDPVGATDLRARIRKMEKRNA